MGRMVDTIVGVKANPGAAFSVVTMNGGDSATVRDFNPGSKAHLDGIIRAGATKGAVRLRSPLLHDNTIGIKFRTDANPSMFLMPPEAAAFLQRGDSLTVEVTGGTNETDLVALRIYYEDFPGASARLFSWGDIAGIIDTIHAFEVDVTNSATLGAWTDTVITATDNVLKADRDYAILGFTTDVAQSVVGVKGADWNNLRLGTSGTDHTEDTSNYFVDEANRTGRPYIPVFNANNRSNTFVSTADVVASSTPAITLVCALLTQRLTTS